MSPAKSTFKSSCIVFLLAFVIPTAAAGGTVKLEDWVANDDFKINSPGGGGAFKATASGGPLAGVDPFVTFCLEYTEHFNLGGTYNYTLSDSAVNGGTDLDEPLVPGDKVSNATKWLYYQAISGGYSSIISAIAGSDISLSGSYIQRSIWVLEHEIQSNNSMVNSVVSALVTAALSHAGDWAGLQAQGHNVYAMNLTDGSGNLRQDQLAYHFVAVPELGTLANLSLIPIAGTLGYFGLGLVALVRRRLLG